METWFDVTRTTEATSVSTSQVGAAFVTRFNNNPPQKICLRFYPVTPENQTVSQSGRMVLWRSGVSLQRNFCGASGNSNTTKKSFRCGDGTELAMECILTQTSGRTYSFVLTTNTGATNSGSYTWSVNKADYFAVRDTTMLGVGTRLVVTAEYDY